MSNNFISQSLGKHLQNAIPKTLAKLIQPLLFKLLAIDQMDKIHSGARDLQVDEHFAERVFHKDVMNVHIDVTAVDLMKIPKSGPIVIVANHPYGGIDGIALLAILKRVRPDVKIMVNYILGGIPELKDDFILVDPFSKTGSNTNSYKGMRDSVKWLKEGHAIGIFPSGEVASYNKKLHRITDKKWHKTVGTIIRSGKSPVQCMYFFGKNSRFFYFLGRINPILRTLCLPREFYRKKNSIIKVKISKAISVRQVLSYKHNLIDFLREKTYSLSSNNYLE